MINHIDGKLIEKTPTHAVIEAAGVGYLLHISLNTFSKITDSERCKLYSHLAIREDAHTLYGFIDQDERTLFRHLISVSGVGASTARMILSSLSIMEIQQAIATGDVSTLKAIKGIGEKSAQRIIVDLKGKLGKDVNLGDNFLVIHNKTKEEALIALVNLGFVKNVAEKAIDKYIKSDPTEKTVEQLIKGALKNV